MCGFFLNVCVLMVHFYTACLLFSLLEMVDFDKGCVLVSVCR